MCDQHPKPIGTTAFPTFPRHLVTSLAPEPPYSAMQTALYCSLQTRCRRYPNSSTKLVPTFSTMHPLASPRIPSHSLGHAPSYVAVAATTATAIAIAAASAITEAQRGNAFSLGMATTRCRGFRGYRNASRRHVEGSGQCLTLPR